MKAGILTLHYGYNEGAVLQAYCVADMLRDAAGLDAEIIDLRYPEKAAVYGPASDDRKRAIAQSASEWLPCSKKSWHEVPSSTFYQQINQDYDRLVVGSDVVWSLKYTRALRSLIPGGLFTRQKEPFYTKFPNAYWLPYRMDIPKYTYAAAVGSFDWSTAPGGHIAKMKSLLGDFTAISVRDEKTHSFLKHLDQKLGADAQQVPDPTLCVDLDRINADQPSVFGRMEAWGLDFNRKKLGLLLGPRETYACLIQFFDRMDWQNASVTTANHFSELPFFEKPLPPQDWARALGAFDFVLTERMHGMIFCLKNHVPFLSVDINPSTPDKPSKVVSLLEKFDLMDCYCAATDPPEVMLTALKRAFEYEWDWDKVERVMAELKSIGVGFVTEHIADKRQGRQRA